MILRRWQAQCVTSALQYFAHSEHFLCLATPGSGKTLMSAILAKNLLDRGLIDFVICFSPSVMTSEGIKATYESVLNRRMAGKMGDVGCSLTYQGMLHLNSEFWALLKNNRVFVVFDEIHHCAGDEPNNANAWGKAILENIKGYASYTLALSGTPWRSDSIPITLSDYSDGNGKINCNHVYGLSQAIADSVCRKPNIVLVDNTKITVTQGASKQTYKSFADALEQKAIHYQELINHEQAVLYLLNKSALKLNELRKENSKAAGLIVAASVEHAYFIQKLMQDKLKQEAVVVTYKQSNSKDLIESFKYTELKWIISVGMISEGTDIPRLQVCCHLSLVKTELYFRQVLGRVLRVTNYCNNEAWLYTFSEQNMLDFALGLANEIPDKHSIKFDDSKDLEEVLIESRQLVSPNPNQNVDTSKRKTDSKARSSVMQIDKSKGISDHVFKSKGDLSAISSLGNFREKIIATYQSAI